jgi:putative hydrolase of the HAD superfamily
VNESAPSKPVPDVRAVTPDAFATVDTWVFDLDNTLYPAGSDLWPKIDARITHWMMHRYGLDGLSSRALQKFYYERYGTTLRGVMATDGVDPTAFLSFVHDIDRTSIVAAPDLAAAIRALDGRKLILTNGSRLHAEKTAAALGLHDVFEDVFDIVSSDLVPKPEPDAYHRFLERHAVDPTCAVMFEDIPRNLVVPKALGMTTVLVIPQPDAVETREAFEIVSETVPAHIDYVTSDLTGFLRAVAAGGSRSALGL